MSTTNLDLSLPPLHMFDQQDLRMVRKQVREALEREFKLQDFNEEITEENYNLRKLVNALVRQAGGKVRIRNSTLMELEADDVVTMTSDFRDKSLLVEVKRGA